MLDKMINFRGGNSLLKNPLGLLLVGALFLAACSPSTATPVVPRFSTSTPAPTPVLVDVNLLYANPWVLVAYGSPDNPTVVAKGVNITAEFTTGGQVNGFAGCNNYNGTFQAATNGAITIGPLATTRMACSQGMDQESAYLTALQSAQRFNFSSQGRLEITYSAKSGPGQVLVFTSSAKPLTGTNWVLISYGDPASPQAAPAGTVITAVFSSEGFVSGFSGCNQYNASYTLQDQQLTLGPVATTQMACPTGMEAEQAYLQALGTAGQVAISGQTLTLTYNQGAGVLNYSAANLPLENTLWTLSVMNGQPLPAETNITAIFTPGETPNTGVIGGSSGCNNYSAGYTQDGSSLAIQQPAVTMMACPEEMEVEQSYLQALQASTSYQVFADRLVLTSPSSSLTYTANRTPLAGALWRLVSLGDVTNPQPPVEGSKFAAQFSVVPGSPSGVLTGTTGCNEYTAAYAASVQEIKINLPVSTQNKTCVPGLVDQEELYFLALQDATTYQISGNTLVLPYDGGKQALVFEGTQLEEAKRPPLNDLNGTTWYLWFIDNSPVLAGTSIYGQFVINPDGESGTISGSAGCNSYVASFGQNLGVQAALNASQQCSEPAGVMEQERAYIDVLSRAYGYWQTGDQLILNTSKGVLTYRATRPPESYDQTHLLVGPTWYLVSFKNTYSLPGTQEPFTLFQGNGSLTGYTGCNNFQGTYSTNIQQITISNLSSTKAACPSKALQDQEQAMMSILSSARSYQVVETVMQLVGDQGVLNYSLTPINRPEEIVPPQAVISAPANAMVGQVVAFDANASTSQLPITSWKWDFGDGAKGTGPVVQHVYNKPGSYTVQMTITDQRGYRDSDARGINIIPPEQPTAVPTQAPPPTAAPTQAPPPTTAPTQAPPPTAAPTQAPPPTAAPTQAPPPTAAPTQAPPPTAVPTNTPEPTPVPTQPPMAPPQAAIQGPTNGYVGEPVTFDASASVAGSSPITSYSWNFGDGTSAGPSPDPAQTTIFNQPGSYQVTVLVADQNGQSSSAATEMVISTRLNTPVVWLLNQIGNQPLLPGTAITLQFLQGQVAGFAGCNTYTGGYSVTQNEDGTYSVAITGLTSTGMACPEEIMQQERTYLAILSTIIGGQVQGNILNLNYPEGSLIYYQAGTPKP